MSAQASIELQLISAWESRVGKSMNGNLQDGRAKAMAKFREAGFPALKSEAWKYTPIRKVLDRVGSLEVGPGVATVTSKQVSALGVARLDAFRVVLVDGSFRADLSDLSGLPEGVRVLDLKSAASDPVVVSHLDQSGETGRDAFSDLNSAFVLDGVLLDVADRVVLERPILIQHIATAEAPMLLQPRLLARFGAGSQARVVEICRTIGRQAVVTNSLAEFFTARHANVDHFRLIDENDASVHINNLRSRQEGDSHFATNVITVSGGTVRNQSYFLPDGENCETHLSGFYLAQGNAHIDNHTLVDHAKPECYSNELFKGILSGRGTGVFNGKVLVREDAQKTNAYQTNKSVILGETARMFSKPELEIYADDVKCSHGATTGALDMEAMFYLQSRGIRPAQARLMLLEAFAADVLDRIAVEAIRGHVDELIRARLAE
jgi:Fe-S cluster assembly protein SufD